VGGPNPASGVVQAWVLAAGVGEEVSSSVPEEAEALVGANRHPNT